MLKPILILVVSLFLGTCAQASETVYTKDMVLDAVKSMPVNGKPAEAKPRVFDVTPKPSVDCSPRGQVDGVGHQETNICPGDEPYVQYLQEVSKGKVTYWRGNPHVGYYPMREDGTLDSSRWRSSVQGELS